MFQDSATFPGNPGDWRKKLAFKEDVRAGDTQTQMGEELVRHWLSPRMGKEASVIWNTVLLPKQNYRT